MKEGETVSISCCWKRMDERVGIKWMKNKTTINNKTIRNQSGGSLTGQKESCSILTISKVTSRDAGIYICKVSVELPKLNEAEGNGTNITVTARENTTNSSADGRYQSQI